LRCKLDRATSEKDALAGDSARLDSQLKVITVERDKLIREPEHLRDQIRRLLAERNDDACKVGRMTIDLDTASDVARRMRDQVALITAELKTSQNEALQAARERDSLREKLKCGDSERDANYSEIRRLRNQVDELTNKLKASQNETSQSAVTFDALRNQVSLLTIERDKAVCESCKLRDSLQQQQEIISAKRARTTSDDKRSRDTLRDHNDRLIAERGKLIQDTSALRGQVGCLTAERDKLVCEAKCLRESSQVQIDCLTAEKEKVSSEVERLRSQVDCLTAQWDKVVGDARRLGDSLRGQIDCLNAERENSKSYGESGRQSERPLLTPASRYPPERVRLWDDLWLDDIRSPSHDQNSYLASDTDGVVMEPASPFQHSYNIFTSTRSSVNLGTTSMHQSDIERLNCGEKRGGRKEQMEGTTPAAAEKILELQDKYVIGHNYCILWNCCMFQGQLYAL